MLKRHKITLFGKLVCVPVDLVGIENALLECGFVTHRRGFERGARYFRARLTGDKEERWAIHEMWIRGTVG